MQFFSADKTFTALSLCTESAVEQIYCSKVLKLLKKHESLTTEIPSSPGHYGGRSHYFKKQGTFSECYAWMF